MKKTELKMCCVRVCEKERRKRIGKEKMMRKPRKRKENRKRDFLFGCNPLVALKY